MRSLQPGLPSPIAIPKAYYKIVINLKDCFFTIPQHPKDCERFAFSVPSVNFKKPMKRYQWTVLPQGMANSPTLCQRFVAQAIQPVRQQWPMIYIIHFTDDVLMARKDQGISLYPSTYLVHALPGLHLQNCKKKHKTNFQAQHLPREHHKNALYELQQASSQHDNIYNPLPILQKEKEPQMLFFLLHS